MASTGGEVVIWSSTEKGMQYQKIGIAPDFSRAIGCHIT